MIEVSKVMVDHMLLPCRGKIVEVITTEYHIMKLSGHVLANSLHFQNFNFQKYIYCITKISLFMVA